MTTPTAKLKAEIDSLRQEVRARVAARSRPLSLVAFARKYLRAEQPDGRLTPLAPGCDFHRWLCAELEALSRRRGSRLNVLAPRGCAKSTWASVAYPLWCVVYHQEPYIVLASDTDDQAKDFLRKIRDQLETNEALLRDFPAVAGVGPVWQSHYLRCRNGVGIRAISTNGKIRGRTEKEARPSLVVVDDPQNIDHIVSPAKRERSWQWLVRDVCNAGSPRTNIVVLGTALHREAIVCKLQTTPGWKSKVFRSLERWPERMDLWGSWEAMLHDWDKSDREAAALAFYEAHREAMHAGAEVLWPDREPLYALMSKRASDGPAAFASEKQNDPVDPALCEWPPECFDHAAFWFEHWPTNLLVRVLSLDPSKGGQDKSDDYAAFIRWGCDARGVEYIEADLRRADPLALVDAGIEHLRQFHPDAFALEANTFQSLFAPLLQMRIAEMEPARRVAFRLELVDNTTNKDVRIRRLTEPLVQRKVRFKARSPGTALLVQQLKDFPNADHDDGPDSWEQARRVGIELVSLPHTQRGPTRLRT
jgi:predicted phage terminase large subunit-like protein